MFVFALTLTAVFAISNGAIALGYIDLLGGLHASAVAWVYDDVPVILTSAVLTALVPLNILFSYFTARGRYKDLKGTLYLLSAMTPFFALIMFLPNPRDFSLGGDPTTRLVAMWVLVAGAQLAAAALLCDRAWDYATPQPGERDIFDD